MLLAAGASTALVWTQWARHHGIYARLAAATGPIRPTEGRLAGFPRYAPYSAPFGATRDSGPVQRIARELQLRPAGAESRGELAMLHLVRGKLDLAARELEAAAGSRPGDAALLSDLSAVYGERGLREGRAEDFAAALETAERALAAAPDLPEALFNRALALAHLHVEPLARQAWRSYLERDPDSPWSEEARAHLRRPPGGSIRLASTRDDQPPEAARAACGGARTGAAAPGSPGAAPREARARLEDQLMPRWAAAVAGGDSGRAAELIVECREVGAALAARGGGALPGRIVEEMAAATRALPGSEGREALAGALIELGEGRSRLQKHDYAEAMRKLAGAERTLASLHSGVLPLVRYQMAVCLFQQNRSAEAGAALDRLGEVPWPAEDPVLEGRRQWMLGLVAQRLADPTRALAHSARALELFAAIHDDSTANASRDMMAESLESLGRHAEAWRQRSWALASETQSPLGIHRYSILDESSLAALAEGRPLAARDFQVAAASAASDLQLPQEHTFALLRLARISAALGRDEEARAVLDQARGSLKGLGDGLDRDARAILQAELDLVSGEVGGGEDPVAAVLDLRRALDFQVRQGAEMLVPDLLGALARYEIRLGALTAAGRDLHQALGALDRQRALVMPGTLRVSLLDQAQPLYETAIALELRRQRPAAAFEVLERSHARALLDRLSAAGSSDGVSAGGGHGHGQPSWRELCRRLPEHTVAVAYAVVEGRLVTWLVRRSGIALVTGGLAGESVWHPLGPSWREVDDLVGGLRSSVANGGPSAVRRRLESLGQLLVAPWSKALEPGDRLVLVPALSLWKVPFAALIDRGSGRRGEKRPRGTARSYTLSSLGSIFTEYVLSSRRVVTSVPHDELVRWEAVVDSQAASSLQSGESWAPYRLSSSWLLDCRKGRFDLEKIAQVISRCSATGLLERQPYAQLALAPWEGRFKVPAEPSDYLSAIGVDVNRSGRYNGDSVAFADVEQSWLTAHEVFSELVASQRIVPPPPVQSLNPFHGTAVVGVVAGSSVRFSGGIAPGVGVVFLESDYDTSTDSCGHVADAIVHAVQDLKGTQKGGIILLEQQRGAHLLPVEIDPCDQKAVQLAVSEGFTVIEAAGNGQQDLSKLLGSSQAILVASTASNTNFGSPPVSCFAEGTGIMAPFVSGRSTTDYFPNFDGTSAAAAIIAGAAILVQDAYFKIKGVFAQPAELQRRLTSTTVPSGTAQIGVMPNVGQIIATLEAEARGSKRPPAP